jgi:hypothetical protein
LGYLLADVELYGSVGWSELSREAESSGTALPLLPNMLFRNSDTGNISPYSGEFRD